MGQRTVVFSAQQREIIRELTADGADNECIAERLGTSKEVVNTQLRRAYKASGCTNRTELAVKIMRRMILLG